MSHIQNAPKYAMKNREAIKESASAGCYHCLAVISTQEIVDWTDWDSTALCPKCGSDCLIAQSHSVPLDQANLQQIHEHWFGKK